MYNVGEGYTRKEPTVAIHLQNVWSDFTDFKSELWHTSDFKEQQLLLPHVYVQGVEWSILSVIHQRKFQNFMIMLVV